MHYSRRLIVQTLVFSSSYLHRQVSPPETLVVKEGTTWARNGRWILPEMPDFHITFRDLLHAVNLRHGTKDFTSLPKEGVLRIFSPWKIRRLRPGLNPRTWVPKASTLPLDHWSRFHYAVCLGDKLTTFRIIVGPSHSKVKQSKKKKFLNYLTLKNVRNQEPKQSQHSPRSPCTRNTEPLEISLWQPHLSRLYIQLFIKWCCRYFILCKVDGMAVER